MYTLLLYVHVLALVYWLGGDLGTFLSSRHVLRSELGVESRQTAFKILMECDMGPRLAMPIILGSGCHLAALRWPTVLPGEVALAGWLLVAIWVGLVAAIHSPMGHRMPSLTQWDLRLRFAVVIGLLAASAYGLSLGLPGWIALKIAVFAVLVACGIAVRFALKPFAIAYASMLSEGPSDAGNAAMITHMGVVRRYVWVIWIGLFVNAALGLHVIPLLTDAHLHPPTLGVSRWLLAAISSLSPFGISIMVPLVPMLSISLDRSVSDLQYLFSIYVIGLAVSQPLFGLVTDRIGRRLVLLWGFAVFVGASTLLIFVDTLGAMIFLRFMQAVGVGVGTVVARGLIRDHLPPDEALKAFALLTAAMGFTPVIAPVVGGYLASLLGMASVFVVLALLGAGLLLLCVKSIPHDEPVDREEGHATSLKGYLSLLRSLRFWGHAGAFGFLQGMVFTLLATGSVLFQEQFGLSMEGFSLIWGSSALVYVFGSFLLSRLSSLGTPQWQHRAVLGMLGVSLSAPGLIAWQGLTLAAVVLPLFSSMLLSGILTPTTMYGAVNAVPRWSGSAAGLSSSVGMTMAGLFSWLGATLYETEPALIMICFGGAGIGFVLCWWLAHREG